MSAAWCGRRAGRVPAQDRRSGSLRRPPTRPASKESIDEVVRQQVDAGIDIVSDGEFSKGRNWAFYIHDRLTGVATRPLHPGGGQGSHGVGGRRAGPRRLPRILRRIRPGLGPRQAARLALRRQRPLIYSDVQVKRDIANLKAAAAKAKAHGAFLPVVAPASALAGRQERALPGRAEPASSRSPTACTRNTRPSSMPASTCRSTMPSCPTCTKRWCRR